MTERVIEGCQTLTFFLGDETYGVKIEQVREVLDSARITKVPSMPDYMQGVINLREHMVPVADIKKKFGLGVTEQSINTCIVIVEVQTDEKESLTMGMLVDSVEEVCSFTADEIQPAPKLSKIIDNSYIYGMAKKDERFVIILDIDRVFSENEIKEFSNAS